MQGCYHNVALAAPAAIMKPAVTLETKLISRDDPEMPGQAETGSPRHGGLHSMLLSGFKYLLQLPKQEGCLANLEQGRSCLAPDSSRPGRCPWKKLLIALGTVIVLTCMVLLLLWHYKCIVIDQYCEGNREVLPPLFKILQRKGP